MLDGGGEPPTLDVPNMYHAAPSTSGVVSLPPRWPTSSQSYSCAAIPHHVASLRGAPRRSSAIAYAHTSVAAPHESRGGMLVPTPRAHARAGEGEHLRVARPSAASRHRDRPFRLVLCVSRHNEKQSERYSRRRTHPLHLLVSLSHWSLRRGVAPRSLGRRRARQRSRQ